MNKIKEFFKNNIRYILILVIVGVIANYPLPYYIEAPGGTIDITNRIDIDGGYSSKGSLNLLYVTEYRGNVMTYLMGLVLPNFDIEKQEERQVSNESTQDIYIRNRVMLENSIDSATILAYRHANKTVNITGYNNVILVNYNDNDLKIGDNIISIDNVKVSNLIDIKNELDKKEANDIITVGVIRNNKEHSFKVKLDEEKKLGIIVQTDYEYELDPEINIKFKTSESGSSGGLMLALSIYNAITSEDITHGLKVAGTGTIDIEGNVGEIGGVKYKIMGAVRNKMDLVFVPEANYEEAIKVKKEKNYDIDIIKVNTFEEALNYLNNLSK